MRQRFFDLVLLGLVLVFAFLASSFAVRNSDFWLHLASGRLLAEGQYRFGVDPFAFTSENRYWANHAWLFDWSLYLLYSRFGEHVGGAVLVVLKALLMSLLALVLVKIGRTDRGHGWAAACTLLAVLAMSPRLLLHSTLLSYVLLGLTLGLLCRPGESIPSFSRQVRHYAPLLLVFVLWVNVDGWFLLGPLLAALFWLGDRLLPSRGDGERLQPTPAWLWPAGLAVCLINPHHLHAFTLPTELLPLPEALQHDAHFASLHVSPWHKELYYQPLSGLRLAGCAYLLLLAVGGLSFLLNVRRLVGWRLLVWLAFAGLSAWRARTIPFFAVVAVPITALNLQGTFSLRQERLKRWTVWASYLTLFLSAFLLIGLAWFGWLQGFRDNSHHVSWGVQPDSSLRRVAQTLHLWHRQGKLGEGRGFLCHPSLVHYCAYYCPEEKGFLDQRLPLFRHVADAYEEIRRALNPDILGKNKPVSEWHSYLRNWGITHLVLYDPILPRLLPTLGQLADEKGAWTLLSVEGQALIIGWRDKGQNLPKGVPLFDADALAFRAASMEMPGAALAEAPARGRPSELDLDHFWSHLRKPRDSSPWQTAAAALLLDYFQVRIPYEMQKRLTWSLALIGLPALPSGGLDNLLRLAVHLEQTPPVPEDLMQQSPALPLLAVRAARQALAENPEDANAYRQLGFAYLDLARQTPERVVLSLQRPLAELRHIQIAVALENALRRDPDSLDSLRVHQELAMLYEGRSPPFLNPPFLDAALEHRRAVLQLQQRIGPAPGEDTNAFARRIQENESNIQELARLVSDRKNEFALKTRNLGSEPYRKAELALRLGLGRLALEDVLMPSSIVLLGGEGVRLQVRLQLMLGQIDPIRAQLHDPDWQTNKANLGSITLDIPDNSTIPAYHLPTYEWLLLCQTAADGNYEEAEAVVEELGQRLAQQRFAQLERDLRSKMGRVLGLEVALSASPQGLGLIRGIVQQLRLETGELLHRSITLKKEQLRTQAMLQTIAGMLALERGRPQQAQQAFRQVAVFSQGVEDSSSSGNALLAEIYLHLLELASQKKQ